MKRKKGALHYVILGFMAAIFLIAGLCVQKIGEVERRIALKNSYEEKKDFCKIQGDIIRDMSRFLTEQSEGFVFLEDKAYMNRYVEEVKEKKTREEAMQALEEAGLTNQELIPIKSAIKKSNSLMEQELWAMRMVAEAMGMEKEEMQKPIREVKLSTQEMNMSPELKKESARKLMMDTDYLSVKKEIRDSLTNFQNLVQERRNESVAQATAHVKEALFQVQFLNILLVLFVLLGVSIFYIYVIIPFLRYSKALACIGTETGDILKPGGSREMRVFANMFNHIYANLLLEQKKLEKLNSTDMLTGIANRAALEEYVETLLNKKQVSVGFLMIDVDNFKLFNDGFGHLIGDQVLMRMGSCFGEMAKKAGGIAGRLGGEEFVVILPDSTVNQVEHMAAHILDMVMNIDIRELGIKEGGIRITVSVGSTYWQKGRTGDIKSMIRQADVALYQAKGRGKNQHVMYSEEEALFKRLESETQRRIEVESDMYRALEKEEFIPFFQPKYDLITGEICGSEALVRWEHREKGYLYPDYFVPVLEKDGFITKIDFAMFEKICACIREWKEMGLPLKPVACNFSRLNFGKETIVKELKAITEQYGVSNSLIQVELTENSLMEREAAARMEEELKELHAAGFTIAIDDFGSGYSSLGMLHELSADVLKIDKSFLQRDLKLKANELLLKGILFIAKTMKMDTVVEGVETKEQAELLKSLGFRVVQGFYFSKPVKKADFETMMKEQSGGAE